MKKCPWCGKNVPKEDQFCQSCGYDFKRGEMSSFYDQRRQKQEKSKIRHKNEMVIVATLAIIAGGSYIFNHNQEQTEAQQNIQQTTKTISDSSASSETNSASQSSSAKTSAKSSSASVKKNSASSSSKKAAKKSSQAAQSSKNVKKQADKSSTKKSSTRATEKKPMVKKNVTQAKTSQLSTNMKPTVFAAAVAKYAAQKNVSQWKSVVNNSHSGILIRETTQPDIVNYLSAKGTGTVYVAFNSNDSNKEIVYSAYTINQDGSVNIYEFGTPSAPHTGDIYNPVETVSQQDMVNYLNSHKQAKNVKQMAQKVGIAQEQ